MASALHRHDGSFVLGNSHQSAWNRDPVAASIEHVGSQHHAARTEGVPDPIPAQWTKRPALEPQYSCGRAFTSRRTSPFPLAVSSAPKTGSMLRDGNAGFTTTESRWLNTQSSAYCSSAPPGGDRRKFEPLAQQVSAKAGKKRHDRRSLNQAAPKCVGNLHVSSHDSVHQARHAQERIGRSSRGSQKLSSTRRKITSTLSSPSTVFRYTRRSRTVKSAPWTNVNPGIAQYKSVRSRSRCAVPA